MPWEVRSWWKWPSFFRTLIFRPGWTSAFSLSVVLIQQIPCLFVFSFIFGLRLPQVLHIRENKKADAEELVWADVRCQVETAKRIQKPCRTANPYQQKTKSLCWKESNRDSSREAIKLVEVSNLDCFVCAVLSKMTIRDETMHSEPVEKSMKSLSLVWESITNTPCIAFLNSPAEVFRENKCWQGFSPSL